MSASNVRRLRDTSPLPAPAKIQAPAVNQRLLTADTPFPGDVAAWAVGCHGGAGTSSLAASLDHLGDAGQIIPAANTPAMVVLVAATHREGLEAAHRAILQFTSGNAGGATLLGLALVDTAAAVKLPRKLARDLKAREGVVTAAAPQVWRVPHIPAWSAMLTDDLPSWDAQPDDPDAQITDKLRAKASAQDHTPLSVVDVGRDILSQAQTIYQQLTK
jgi:hypothetical protein